MFFFSEMPSYDQQRFCFTLNNYTEADETILKSWYPDLVKYIVWQPEVGENGTPHLQGCFVTSKRFPKGQVFGVHNGVRIGFTAAIPALHLEVMRGTVKQASEYCKKPETAAGAFTELGTLPKSGGEQMSETITQIRKDSREGKTVTELEETYPLVDLRYPKFFAKQVLTATRMKARQLSDQGYPEVYWLYGKTGSGKTTLAKQFAKCLGEDYFFCDETGSALWFDGYEQETVLIVDDVHPRWAKLDQLKSFTDRARESRIQVKGSMKYLSAEHVILTSCDHPMQVKLFFYFIFRSMAAPSCCVEYAMYYKLTKRPSRRGRSFYVLPSPFPLLEIFSPPCPLPLPPPYL